MKKHILVAFIGLAVTAPTSATEWGIGFSTQSDDQTIYFPIKAGDKLRIEPFFREKSITYNRESIFDRYKITSKSFSVGMGVFGITNIKEKSQLYYGARVSYQETVYTYKSENFNLKDESNGYQFSPTIGFEYMLTDNILIGGEAEWAYSDTSLRRTYDNDSIDTKRSETEKRFILRYLF